MRNAIFLALFLLLIGGLIYWLWSDKDDEQTLEQAIAQQEMPAQTGVPKIDLEEVDIFYDDNGLVLAKLFNQNVDLVLTTNPVRNVEVFEGIMTYEEQIDGAWNFRSYNLAQYIEVNLKE